MPIDNHLHTNLPSSPTVIRDEWSTPDEQANKLDQFQAYIAEGFAHVAVDQSPIPY